MQRWQLPWWQDFQNRENTSLHNSIELEKEKVRTWTLFECSPKKKWNTLCSGIKLSMWDGKPNECIYYYFPSVCLNNSLVEVIPYCQKPSIQSFYNMVWSFEHEIWKRYADSVDHLEDSIVKSFVLNKAQVGLQDWHPMRKNLANLYGYLLDNVLYLIIAIIVFVEKCNIIEMIILCVEMCSSPFNI